MLTRRLKRWILGTAPFACGLGALAGAMPTEDFLLFLAGIGIYGSALGGLGWACGLLTRNLRLKKALEGGFYDKGLRMLQTWRRDDELIETLRDKVPFPDDGVRERMVVAVRELLALQVAAADRSNPHISDELRKDIRRRCRQVLLSLWPKCQDLVLLGRPGMDPAAASAKISQILAPLDQLAEMTAAARSRIANATLAGSSLEIHDALESAGAMKWQTEEAPRIQAMLEGG